MKNIVVTALQNSFCLVKTPIFNSLKKIPDLGRFKNDRNEINVTVCQFLLNKKGDWDKSSGSHTFP